MNTITIDKKEFVVIEKKQFEQIQKQAAAKTEPQKKLSLAAGKKFAHQLIDKWQKGK